MMDDMKIDDIIDEQMDDMAELVKRGMAPDLRAQATQAIALLGIWDELRRRKVTQHVRIEPVNNFPPFAPGLRGRKGAAKRLLGEDIGDFKPGLTD